MIDGHTARDLKSQHPTFPMSYSPTSRKSKSIIFCSMLSFLEISQGDDSVTILNKMNQVDLGVVLLTVLSNVLKRYLSLVHAVLHFRKYRRHCWHDWQAVAVVGSMLLSLRIDSLAGCRERPANSWLPHWQCKNYILSEEFSLAFIVGYFDEPNVPAGDSLSNRLYSILMVVKNSVLWECKAIQCDYL